MTPAVSDLPARLETARRAVRAAAAVCLEASDAAVMRKPGSEPVTLADFASQAVLLREIGADFPDDRILAEESGGQLASLGGVEGLAGVAVLAGASGAQQLLGWLDHTGDPDSDSYWAIDPIDGTKGFIRGDQFAVAVGFVTEEGSAAGVLGCPRLTHDGERGVLVWGGPGIGAFVEPIGGGAEKPIRVSSVSDPEATRVLGSHEPAHGDPRLVRRVIDDLGLGGGWVRMDSQAKYAALALGTAEVYLRPRSRQHYRERVWDHAAGAAVVQGAGGIVSDSAGVALDFGKGTRLEDNRGVLASNGALHDAVVEAIRGLAD